MLKRRPPWGLMEVRLFGATGSELKFKLRRR